MARPTKLTPAVSKRICDNICRGLAFEQAATLAGVSATVFYNWKARGKKEETGLYVEFLKRVKKAEAAWELEHLKIIADAAQPRVTEDGKVVKGSWQASAWMLERRVLKRYGRTQHAKVELSGKDGGPIELNLGGAARELLRGRLLQSTAGEGERTADKGVDG